MASGDSHSLVETEWLAQHLDAPDVVVVDASWYLPTTGRSGKDEFQEARIPGAQFFDIDALSDDASNLPHMLPNTVQFASFMKRMGIGDGIRVIAYDKAGILASARVWWILRVMGHHDVSVLNGGLQKWIAEDRPIETGDGATRASVHFTARMNASLVADRDDMMKVAGDGAKAGGVQVVDARPAGRFSGAEPEPRAGLRKGHIPGSRNVPYSNVLNSDGTMKDADELRRVFLRASVNPGGSIITTCGSGVSAAVLALALAQLGNETVAVYDGSFAEWGQPDNGLPVETN